MTWVNTWWNQVAGTVVYGLQITVVGMLLVFFTLALIIVALILLTRIPGLQPRAEPMAEANIVASNGVESAATDDDLAQVAAIAVALLRSRRKTTTRSRAQTPRSAWKHYGRAHQIGL